jgi:hypothetical protein
MFKYSIHSPQKAVDAGPRGPKKKPKGQQDHPDLSFPLENTWDGPTGPPQGSYHIYGYNLVLRI